MTTRLATNLIAKVYIPRHGIVEQLKIGDARSMGNTIFYSTLKSLDIMTAIREIGFSNDPIVSSELVKFLALNTEFDTIKKLAEKNQVLRQEIEHVKESTKAASTTANKLDDLKRHVESMNKRLKSVDHKD